MLEQADVAGHESGSGEADDLPERIVPGHDGEDGADGTVADEAFFGAGFDDFVGEYLFGVLGVIAAGGGALYGLGDGGFVGLAHFEGHEMSEFIFVAFEDLGGFQHAAGALGEGSLALGVESGNGELELLLDLGAGKRLESLQGFAGSGINGGNGHDESSFGDIDVKSL